MKVRFAVGNGNNVEHDILDLDLVVDRAASTRQSIRVHAACDDELWKLDFRPNDAPFFVFAEPPRSRPVVH